MASINPQTQIDSQLSNAMSIQISENLLTGWKRHRKKEIYKKTLLKDKFITYYLLTNN
jgi:hypothetical protein